MKKLSKTFTTSKTKNPINIFLLGSPGAGKATQAKFLARKYKLYDFDMGIEQDRQRRKDKKLDELFKKYVDTGKMNKTRVYRRLCKDAIVRTPLSKGILFDGHPKMPEEVVYVSRLLRKLGRTKCVGVYLEVPWAEAKRRNLLRAGYGSGKKRKDDTEVALKRRYYYARALIQQSKGVYKKLYPFMAVSGLGSVEEVRQRVAVAVTKLLNQADEKGDDKNQRRNRTSGRRRPATA